MNAAEIKIELFRDIDNLPEQYLPGLRALVQKYVNQVPEKTKSKRKLGIMKGLVKYMAPDFNDPLDDFTPYMS